MFAKLSILALCAAPLVSGLTLHPPTDISSQGEVTITWDTAPGDPESFTLELNHPSFNDALAIANNIDPARGSITLTIPVVPAQGGYTLEAVNIGNINDVYAVTGPFAIAEPTASIPTTPVSTGTGTASRTATGTGSVTTGASATHSGSASASGSGASGSASHSGSSSAPNVTNLADSHDDSSATSSIASRLGLLGAAAVGAALAL
ncbi:hypothetical protein E4U52_001274 [Claviceps spartinae]|uniref:Yeast cell wall synthesis Kre9/Knh1-like N-terminal domain-containing protein n=1 Tax=Coprinopsis cinerea (strain Okayama-7 / 130 / ATCC MYA-4618 / FGSC 9003) TaxID=240176 RepID=D6RKC7_COPC7|nr:hypothetical protein CC1G_13780 [Coprinopsis cinerea okayama7\|eukprot:XP_002912248.1 hypothetical protein CC1G_13780 [Coprinopsis cinerea okayama7\